MSSDSVSFKKCTKHQLSTAVSNLRRLLDPAVQQLRKGARAPVQNGQWLVSASRDKDRRRIVKFQLTKLPASTSHTNGEEVYDFEAEYVSTYLTQESLKSALSEEGSVGLLEALLK